MQKKFGIVFAVVFTGMIILNPAFAQSEIPSWVKNSAGWWADDAIDDQSFAQGIDFLMKEGLLKTSTIPDEFPSHLKTDSKNWADDVISDKEYLLILENWIEDNNQESVKEIVSSPSSSNLESLTGNQRFESIKHGIEFSVPEGWFLQELDKMEEDSPDVVAVGPKIGGMSPVISLTVKQTSQRTLDEIISENTEKLRQEVESGNLEIISQKNIIVNGNQAHATDAKGIFSTNGKNFDVKFIEVIIYDSEKFYTLAYSNSVNNFDSQFPRFEEAVDSFEILAKNRVYDLESEVASVNDNELLFDAFPFLRIYEDLIVEKPNKIQEKNQSEKTISEKQLKEAIINDPLYDIVFDPVVVRQAEKGILLSQKAFKVVLDQCNSIESYSDYLVLVDGLALVQDEVVQALEEINDAMISLELSGYDNHHTIGPLIKETRQLAGDAGNCIIDVQNKYGN